MRVFRKDLKNKTLVVLDIGSQFLKALLLEINKDEEKGVLREWIREKTVPDFDGLYSICQRLINKLEKKAGLKAEEIFLGMGGEIARGASATFCYRRENPKQKIDLSELKYLLQKFQWKTFEKIRKTFALETELSEAEVRLINAHVVSIKIDGHFISNPLGFQGETICLTIFNTYASVQQLGLLKNLISRTGLELIGIAPSSYALFHCLDLEKPSKGDVLIIDIGGRITEVTLIRNEGELIETKSFQLGGQAFTKTLADFLELGIDESELIKIKYAKGEVSPGAKAKLEKLFAPNLSSWLGGVKIVLAEFFKKYKVVPSKVFLCGGGSSLPGIKETLEKDKNLQVRPILAREIIKIENRTKLKEIPCLALAKLALELPAASEFSFTLRRAMKLIQD